MLNNDIYSKEDEIIANFLKDRNLEKTNRMQGLPTPRESIYTKYIKRVLDIIITISLSIFLLPVLFILSLLVRFNLGKPVIYRQSRVGKDGKVFNMLKFRSMTDDRDSEGQLLPPQMRLTKFGLFIRKYSLDELPQLYNIIRGDMSIIGPRPLPVFFSKRMSERHLMRNCVKPGLECPYITPVGTTLNPYQLEFENDIEYIENIGFLKDVQMFFRLIKLVLNVDKRKKHAGALSYFMGYDDNGLAIGMTGVNKQYNVSEILKEKNK